MPWQILIGGSFVAVGVFWLLLRLTMRTEHGTIVRKVPGFETFVVKLDDGTHVEVGVERNYGFRSGDTVAVSTKRRDGEDTVAVFGGRWRRLYGPTMTIAVGTVLLALELVEIPWFES